MKIGVDAGCLGVKDMRLKVGVYNFAANLLIELSKIDTENEYFLYSFHPIDPELLKKLGPNMQNIIVRPVQGWLKIWLPIRMLRDRVQVFLALGQAVPPRMMPTIKTIGVIYDLAFEKYKKYYPDSYTQLHSNTSLIIKRSAHIITISKSVKNDVISHYNIDSHHITAIPLGVRNFLHRGEKKKVRRNPYFLYVGALKRIKNVPTLLKAFKIFAEKTKNDVELVVVGGDKWKDPQIDTVLSAMPDETIERISFIGFSSDEELVHLYRHALAFVSPSYYEGFGLTFLEAMASGCPVIASNAGSLPEVVGKAGILVDPTDVDALAQAMIDVYKNSDLRAKLSKKGISEASGYSWEKCAREVHGLLEQFS
ncbi:MAG TPA: glycosyltransferase family 1 protein [Candidatus Woesebacteria bacterium]|nr:glycosyltransferase family 1 protein [Candidatus Woesebacteria bacterium]